MNAVMPQLVSAIAALGIYQQPRRPLLNATFSLLNAANYSYTLEVVMPRLKCTTREATSLDESIFQPLFTSWNGTDPFTTLCTTPTVTFASNQSFDANCSTDSNSAIRLQQQPGLYLGYALTNNGSVVTDGTNLLDADFPIAPSLHLLPSYLPKLNIIQYQTAESTTPRLI
jgi:hypothetical protein